MVETSAMRPVLLVFSLIAATCQRVDEPAPAAEHAPTSAAGPAVTSAPTAATAEKSTEPPPRAPRDDAASTQPDAGRCIQPLVEPPPPIAKPAATCPPDDLATPPTLRRGKIAVPEAKGAPVLDVEIADTPATEQRGLMFRTKLGAEEGMIFVWKRESFRSFWMRNTCIPLDMLFVALDGT